MKKLLSMFLTLLMVVGVFTSVCVPVSATEETTQPPVTENENTEIEPTDPEPTEPEEEYTYATAISKLEAKVNGINVEWTCDGEADSYNVYRRAAGESAAVLLATVTELNYLDTDVKNNVYYKYHIEAVVDSEVKATSEGVLTKYLAAAKNVKVSLNTTGTAWVQVSWEPVTGATGYEIYCRTAGQTKYRKVGSIMSGKAKESSYIIIDSGYHRFAVVPICGKYVGALDTNGPLIKYFEKPYIRPHEFVENGVKIKWDSCANATGYRVYRRAGGEKYYTYLCTTTSTDYTDTTAVSGKYYRYVVRGVYGTVFGPYDTAGVFIQYVTKPKLQAIANATNGVYVRWEPVAGAKRYNILRREAGGTYHYIKTVDASKGNRYKDTTAVPLEYYRYTVEAVSALGNESGYDKNGLFIKHNPLGTTWSKDAVLNYYNFHTDESCAAKPQYTMKLWQNVDSQSTTGSNKAFVNEFKQIMASQYVPASDPMVYTVTDYNERGELFPNGWASSQYVKSATIARKDTYDVVTIVMKDEVSPEVNEFGIKAVSDNYFDFAGLVEEFRNEGYIKSGTSKSTYKNFTIVATFTKDGKLISATHSCKNIVASMDLNFINDIGKVKYNVQFDTYLTYSGFKY